MRNFICLSVNALFIHFIPKYVGVESSDIISTRQPVALDSLLLCLFPEQSTIFLISQKKVLETGISLEV